MKMKPKIDLLNWVLSGNLAGVFVGDTKERVYEQLGPPRGCAGCRDMGEIPNWQSPEANVWGYGIWTLEFIGDILDYMGCDVTMREEYGWGFDLELGSQSFFNSVDEAQEVLERSRIPFRCINEAHYRMRDLDSGALIERRRRFCVPTILAGEGLRTRIVFNQDGGQMWILAQPFQVEFQTFGLHRISTGRRLVLL